MKQQTKIQFLPVELELVSSTDFIFTKNTILLKIKTFFEELQAAQLQISRRYMARLPQEVFRTSPKISKGENYKGLPWLVLDNPRHFVRHNIFAIRTMFWWGKFFSTTLHLSGTYKIALQKKIIMHKRLLAKNNFLLSTEEPEWEQDVEAANFHTVGRYTKKELEKMVAQSSFLKLATKFPLASPAAMEQNLYRSYMLLLKVCSQLPSR